MFHDKQICTSILLHCNNQYDGYQMLSIANEP